MSASDSDTDRKPPLDYATPVRVGPISGVKFSIALASSFLIAVGVGLVSNGWLIAERIRESTAHIIAAGLVFLIMGSGIIGSYFFARMR